MGFFEDMLSTPVSLVSPIAGGVLGRGERKRRQEVEAARNRQSGIAQERMDLLSQGMEEGRKKGELLTGQDMRQTGMDTSDIVRRRREMLDAPSRAESQILAKGQNTARRAKAAGASDAQQRQIELETGQRAGLQGDVDRERRLQNFQSLTSNIMRTQSALEPGYGNLFMSSQYIAPEERDIGLLGNLFKGLGL